MPTFLAFDNVFFSARSSFMTNLITLKADFFIAFKGIMSVFATKNARFMLCLIWAVLLHMTNLAAIMTFNCWILLSPISLAFHLSHIVESVIVFGSYFTSFKTSIINTWEWNFTIRFLSLLLLNLFLLIFFVFWFIFFFYWLLFLFIFISKLAKIFISPHKLRSRSSFISGLPF